LGEHERGWQRGTHFGKGPKGYKRSDQRIEEEVNEELTRHPEIDASEIEVRVQNGDVTLSGAVEGREQKRMAEDIAERCAGVNEVHNQIRVHHRQGASSAQRGQEQSGGESRGRTGTTRAGASATG
jgi:osmotically-inducible protein OsmY